MSEDRGMLSGEGSRGAAPDPWSELRRFTAARIGLGHADGALPTGALLSFQEDHAAARDAIFAPFSAHAVADALGGVALRSRARDRAEYLRRPDLGRRLLPEDATRLSALPAARLALVVADGLSPAGVTAHGVALVSALRTALAAYEPGSPVVVTNGRVAISDEIGALLRAEVAIIVIGERPGLSAADSLGVYLTYGPAVGNTDERRNCLSNVRPAGMPLPEAVARATWLVGEALARRLSGVTLKDETPANRIAGA